MKSFRLEGERSDGEQYFGGASLVHRLLPFGGVLQWQSEVEHHAWIDLPLPDELDEVREETPDRCGAAVQVHLREEQSLPIERDAVGDTDETDVPSRVARHGWLGPWPPGSRPLR